MSVNANDPRPPYVQVADSLRAAIRSGALPPGTRLPSGRDLANRYGVALMTVQKATDVLRSERLVRSHQGRGVFVADDAATDENELVALKAGLAALAERVSELERKVGSEGDSHN